MPNSASTSSSNDTASNTDNHGTITIDHHLDTQGLICPEPVMLLHKTIRQAKAGEVIEILATDPASTRDVPNFCRHLGHELLLAESLNESLLNEGLADNDSNDPAINNINSPTCYRFLVKKKQTG